ncbi:MAG: UDP-N-acetylmuramoyl-L-alanyl-D-glutamate--2,6-diaminopimelate ligase [Anaerolineales bacterium]|nr:UDP-N-acetylmuramoyl-L-alanyl-D-glutamate--2,6-diaminopimelate ligase [Anaerolineales bacterium]
MRLSHLLASLPTASVPAGRNDPDITDLTADSRTVAAGSLFVAIPGEYHDGRRYIGAARERGAAAVVAEAGDDLPPDVITVPDGREALAWLAAAWHGHPSRQLVLIGVTGTDGKTTTSSLIHSVLLAAGLRAGLVSTVSAVIGDETLDTGFHVTTPDAPATQALLARMVAAGLTHCVLEVTSHGLAQHRVTGCAFDVAVVTNITHEHLDFHKTYENYRAAKGRLFSLLAASPAKSGVAAKTAVLNHDDSSYAYLAALLEPHLDVRRLSYGLTAAADFFADAVQSTPAATRFTLRGLGGLAHPAATSLVGAYNLSNALAALTATVGGLGLAPATAARGLAALPGVPGRLERLDLGQPFTAIVDFAHTPNALRRVLLTARQLNPAGRLIAVFGSAGLRDVEKRRLMAQTSAELADLTILTAEDPRTEALDDILEMMAGAARMHGGVEGQTFFRVPDRGAALRLAVSLAQPGDLLLACGKGHEQSMAFGTTEYAWDDRTALRAALAEHLGVPGPAMPYLPTRETKTN